MIDLQLAALLSVGCVGLLAAAGRLRFLARDFPDRPRRAAGLVLLIGVLAVCVFYPTVSQDAADLSPEEIRFPALFVGHAILATFLFLWWLLRPRGSVASFLLLDRLLLEDVQRGLWIGLIGWVFTLAGTAAIAGLLSSGGALPQSPEVPALMPWMAELPAARKLVIIAMAMTVEEAFFRAFLQTRIGWIPSSLLFALSHASYGLPLLMVSVLIISLAIGWTLRQTGRLLPCIVAHGVFDAIQLFVVIPWAVKMLESVSQ